jgi:hypothetical protein
METLMPTLPKAVQDQLDAAEQIEQEMGGPPPNASELEPPPAAPEPEPPPAQPPAPEPTPPSDNDESWRVKYLTLQGIHRADNARLSGEIETLKGQVSDLTQQLAEAKKAPAPAKEPEPAQTLLTQSDIDAFGPDMIDVIQRAAKQIAAQEIGPIKSELATVKAENASLKGTVETVAETQTNQGQAAYYVELAKLVPEYEAVNKEPAFLAWLAEADPMSGLQRQTLLNVAFRDLDPQRTATIFNAFKATQAPAPTPPAPAPAPRDDLTRQIEPGKSRDQIPPTPQPTKVWTPDAIEQFYRDVARGEYKGRQAEAERIEAEIDRSLAATGT